MSYLVYKDQLDNDVIKLLNNEEKTGNVNNLITENKNSIVGSLNEIVGKDIISESIGLPLTSVDTWMTMGDKIDDLLNRFKALLIRKEVTLPETITLSTLIDCIEGLSNGTKNVPGEDYDYFNSPNEVRTSVLVGETQNWVQGCDYTHNDIESDVYLSFYGSQDTLNYLTEIKLEVLRGGEIIKQEIISPTVAGYVKYKYEFRIQRGDNYKVFVRQKQDGGVGKIKDFRVSYSIKNLV